ncbi:MAG: ribokinase [Mangrovicoccus sp.]
MTVYNLGSINIDTIITVPHLPGPGETLAGTGYWSGLGGKGANQSVAVAKAGRQVQHLGRVGSDGSAVLAELAGYGVDISRIGQVDGPTGLAHITVDDAGENVIILLPGANHRQSATEITAALSTAEPGDILLLQNETNCQLEAAQCAKERGLRVIYSAAPFAPEAVRAVLPFIDVLIMNEIEAAQLQDALNCALQDLPVGHILVTEGADGVDLITTSECRHYPAIKVTPVDTTGAGDTFAGYLAAALDRGADWAEAIRIATIAAGIATTRAGTSAAIPEMSDVLAWPGSY